MKMYIYKIVTITLFALIVAGTVKFGLSAEQTYPRENPVFAKY